MAGRAETRRGFTLVEMLAALTIAATAIAALAMAVGVAVAAWSRGNTSAELIDTVGQAASRFTADVASLMPWRFALGNEDRLLFSGDAREVIFAAVAQTGFYGQPRLRLVSYRAITSPGGYTIQRRVARMPADPMRPGNVIWTEPVDLLTGVAAPRFAYSMPAQRGLTWIETWRGSSRLPTAVRLSFTVGDRPVVVDAAVMVDAERDCLLPASQINCTVKGNPVKDEAEAAGAGVGEMTTHAAPDAGRSGFVLVAVLWLGALLMLVASALLQQSRASLTVSHNGVEEVIADALLTAAIEVSASRLSEGLAADGRTKTLNFADGSVNVALLDMNGLVDLNRSAPQLIEALANAAGDLHSARVILARRGQPGDPLEAPWRAREEPADAPGVDPAFVTVASDFATVFGKTGAINPMTAPLAVLMLLPRVTRATAERIVALRERQPGSAQRIVRLLAAGPMVDATPADALDVFLEAQAGSRFSKTVRATVQFETASGTYRIVDWRPWAVRPAWVRGRISPQP